MRGMSYQNRHCRQEQELHEKDRNNLTEYRIQESYAGSIWEEEVQVEIGLRCFGGLG